MRAKSNPVEAPAMAVEASVGADATDLATKAQALAVAVKDEDSYREAAELLTGAVEPMIKRVDGVFGPIVKRQTEALDEARRQRDAIRKPLVAVKDAIKTALAGYQSRLAAARAAVERRITEEATRRSGDTAAPAPSLFLAAVSREERPTAAGISVRETWVLAAVLDPRGLKPEYLAPDERKIKAVVKALGTDAVKAVSVDPERPAISVERETRIASRSTAGG